MKKLFAFALIAGLLISCTSTPDPAAAEAEKAKVEAKAKADEHVAVVEKYLSAFETGDFESWRGICTEDFLTYGPQYDGEGTLDEYIGSMNSFEEVSDSLKSRTIAILAHSVDEGDMHGDYVFWWGINSMYFIEAEKHVKLMIHTVFKMKEGKIEWETDYWDTGDLKSQLSGDKESKKKAEKE